MFFNKNNYKACIPFLGGLIMILGMGCTKNFDDINTPENQIIADKVDITLLGQAFAESEFYGLCGDNQSFQRSESLFADEYSQYFGTIEPNFDSGNFTEVTSWTNRYFNDLYSRALPQLLFVEKYTRDNQMDLANAIAKVWKVVVYHRITDFFGPIIYSQFGNEQISVSYDSQEDVYHDFFKTLDSAVAVLKQQGGKNAFGTNDLVFNGDADKWLRLANSLRLRLATRIAYVDPTLAKQQAEQAVADGVMTDNLQNAMVRCSVNSLNFYAAITYIDEFRMTATMESVMVGYNDPRISQYFDPAVDGGGYHGIRNGLPRVDKGTFLKDPYSFINTKWRPLARGGTNPPMPVMKATELYFLRAEGALRGWNMGGTAMELYNDGITTSLKETTASTDQEIDNYVNSLSTPIAVNDKWNTPPMSDIPVKYDADGGFERQLEQIITQKWIAIFPDGWEAWSERRRTGYPVGYPIIQSFNPDINENGMMRRLQFTTGEISNNAEAVEEARKLLHGADKNYTKLWWDAKP
jgi:hypothetical protein